MPGQWTVSEDERALHHENGMVIRLRADADSGAGLRIAAIELPRDCRPGPDTLLEYINAAHRFWQAHQSSK